MYNREKQGDRAKQQKGNINKDMKFNSYNNNVFYSIDDKKGFCEVFVKGQGDNELVDVATYKKFATTSEVFEDRLYVHLINTEDKQKIGTIYPGIPYLDKREYPYVPLIEYVKCMLYCHRFRTYGLSSRELRKYVASYNNCVEFCSKKQKNIAEARQYRLEQWKKLNNYTPENANTDTKNSQELSVRENLENSVSQDLKNTDTQEKSNENTMQR